MQKLTR